MCRRIGHQLIYTHTRLTHPPSADTAHNRQHHTFDEQLPDDPPACRSERDANGYFPRSPNRAAEHQVGEIGGSDQQHQSDGAPHCAISRGCVRSDEELAETSRPWNPAGIRFWICARELSSDTFQFGACAFSSDAFRQTAEREPQSPNIAQTHDRVWHERYPQILVLRKRKTLAHDSDDGGRRLVDSQDAPNDRRVLSESLFPKSVRQYRNGLSARQLIGRDEIPAKDGLLTEDVKRVRADSRCAVNLRTAGIVTDRDSQDGDGADALKRPGLNQPVLKDGIR